MELLILFVWGWKSKVVSVVLYIRQQEMCAAGRRGLACIITHKALYFGTNLVPCV